MTLTAPLDVVESDGIHVVRAYDGAFAYWVEARTYRNAPVVGTEIKVRGCSTLEEAIRWMKRLTKAALVADPSLKRYLAAKLPNGSTRPAASGLQECESEIKRGRGRPPGSKNRPTANKPGPRPKPKSNRVVFSSIRFEIEPNCVNPIAQVWRCTANFAKARGRAAGKGAVRTGDLPHLIGSYLVTILDDQGLSVALDEDNHPYVYPDWMAAQRDAEHFYAITEGNKLPRDGQVQYVSGPIEVRFMPEGSIARPYYLFNTTAAKYVMEERREENSFARLDTAMKAADDMARKMIDPPSVRLVKALAETTVEREEREAREDRWFREQEARDAVLAREMAEDNAMIASRPGPLDGVRVLSAAEARAAAAAERQHRIDNRVYPTLQEQMEAMKPTRRRGSLVDRNEGGDDED